MFRKAVLDDKEMILNIRKNLYDGLDFLPEFFPHLVSPKNGVGLLVLHEDKAISTNGFHSFSIFDNRRLM